MITYNELRSMNKLFKELEKTIEEFDNIVVYRHVSPDFDALGAQMGLVTYIKDNYPLKTVHYVGDYDANLMKSLFPTPEDVDESFFNKEHLAIVVDVSDKKRISQKYLSKAKKVVKIDHHHLPSVEDDYGDLRIIFSERPAACELIALFVLSRGGLFAKKRIITKKVASYLYCGIVGDTGRFMYQDTDSATLRIAGDLLEKGVDKADIYSKMYETDQRRLNILSFVLSHFKVTEKGTCYYVIEKKDLEALNMTTNEGNLHINMLRDMEGVEAVISVTYDPERGDYRASLRSSKKVLYPATLKFNGGGHDFAAGCRLESLDQLPLLLSEVDSL